MIEPLKDYVLLEVIKEKNDSGLIVPEEKKQNDRAKVVAIGNEVKSVALNDIVLYLIGYGREVKDSLEIPYLITKEENIIAKIK